MSLIIFGRFVYVLSSDIRTVALLCTSQEHFIWKLPIQKLPMPENCKLWLWIYNQRYVFQVEARYIWIMFILLRINMKWWDNVGYAEYLDWTCMGTLVYWDIAVSEVYRYVSILLHRMIRSIDFRWIVCQGIRKLTNYNNNKYLSIEVLSLNYYQNIQKLMY